MRYSTFLEKLTVYSKTCLICKALEISQGRIQHVIHLHSESSEKGESLLKLLELQNKLLTQKILFYLCGFLLSHFSRVRLCVTPHRWQPTRLHRPWDSPGKNTGVGCHFLLQCMKVKSEREVAQWCPTLSDPMDCSLPGSSVDGIFQARVLEWGAIAFSLVIRTKLL